MPVDEGVGLLDPAHDDVLLRLDESGQVTESVAYAGFLAGVRCIVLLGDPLRQPFSGGSGHSDAHQDWWFAMAEQDAFHMVSCGLLGAGSWRDRTRLFILE